MAHCQCLYTLLNRCFDICRQRRRVKLDVFGVILSCIGCPALEGPFKKVVYAEAVAILVWLAILALLEPKWIEPLTQGVYADLFCSCMLLCLNSL